MSTEWNRRTYFSSALYASALQPGTWTVLTEIEVPNREDLLAPARIARSNCRSRARPKRSSCRLKRSSSHWISRLVAHFRGCSSYLHAINSEFSACLGNCSDERCRMAASTTTRMTAGSGKASPINDIAAALDKRNIPAPGGSGHRHAAQVSRLLKRLAARDRWMLHP
jgi:hypothetical protein